MSAKFKISSKSFYFFSLKYNYVSISLEYLYFSTFHIDNIFLLSFCSLIYVATQIQA